MIDSYGRQISYLRLSVTELCNLRCRYCMPEDGICKKRHDEMLTQEETISAIRAAASLGISKLRITGGEPLVKSNIVDLCAEAAAVDGIREVCVTTNGTLLPKLAGPLREAGVRRLNISLDTLDPEKFRYITRIGTLSDAVAGLDAALDCGFERIKVNAVLIGGFN
ncbi:MAG: radical SAM protein, partial [Oscillospiraceae bacterium]|nr:radical SAM protein [Oscillospiraceae bacterium]